MLTTTECILFIGWSDITSTPIASLCLYWCAWINNAQYQHSPNIWQDYATSIYWSLEFMYVKIRQNICNCMPCTHNQHLIDLHKVYTLHIFTVKIEILLYCSRAYVNMSLCKMFCSTGCNGILQGYSRKPRCFIFVVLYFVTITCHTEKYNEHSEQHLLPLALIFHYPYSPNA